MIMHASSKSRLTSGTKVVNTIAKTISMIGSFKVRQAGPGIRPDEPVIITQCDYTFHFHSIDYFA
ncbi:MAG: hypothetical protein CME85_05995 [Henriciella sp.]|nr:hypothetical protein [Henriciella sp.]MBK75036.1 hypothetical protein [Henriciella sp.]